jgi:hypothetical protein
MRAMMTRKSFVGEMASIKVQKKKERSVELAEEEWRRVGWQDNTPSLHRSGKAAAVTRGL